MSRFLLLIALLALPLASCKKAESATNSAFKLKTTALEIGDQKITVEIADTASTMQIGLMYRDSLPENHGMIFVFPELRRAAFWMHETRIPLDIAYLDQYGTILEVHAAKPMDETNIPAGSDQVAYALEMNQGWFFNHKIALGTRVKNLPRFPAQNP